MASSLSKKLGLLTLAAVVVLLLIQLVPYGKHHANPPVVKEPDWDSPATRELAKRACFDCHSHETKWPWYASIAPASWLVQRDVDGGRKRLNFSDWQGGKRRGEHAGEIAEVIEENEMPPKQYLIAHPEARLTAAERKRLMEGLLATLLR
jgi:hypothetical protein